MRGGYRGWSIYVCVCVRQVTKWILIVDLISARDLVNADAFGKSDPFCVLQVDD